jgi:hypothetical protein
VAPVKRSLEKLPTVPAHADPLRIFAPETANPPPERCPRSHRFRVDRTSPLRTTPARPTKITLPAGTCQRGCRSKAAGAASAAEPATVRSGQKLIAEPPDHCAGGGNPPFRSPPADCNKTKDLILSGEKDNGLNGKGVVGMINAKPQQATDRRGRR